jgi:hypothetical protein
MKIKTSLAIVTGLGLTLFGPTAALGSDNGLAGRIFVVRAELRHSLDPLYPAGSFWDACIWFNEDGTWVDPLWPDYGIAVPGVWYQHSEHPRIAYTVTVPASTATFDLLYIQRGVVWPARVEARHKHEQKLHAYSSAWATFDGETVAVYEFEIRGRAVDQCPYDFPLPPYD